MDKQLFTIKYLDKTIYGKQMVEIKPKNESAKQFMSKYIEKCYLD